MSHGFRKLDLLLLPLRKLVESGEYPKGTRLPSMQQLAQKFSVSVGTVRRAVDMLVLEGLVEVRASSGVYIKRGKEIDLQCPVGMENAGKGKPEKIADTIEQEISSGNWRVGDRIPSLKSSEYRFMASAPTLNKAMRILEQKGLTHKAGKSWIVGPVGQQSARSTGQVYAISWGALTLEKRGARTIRSSFLLPFERELANLDIRFRGDLGPNDPKRPSAQMLVKKGALGFLMHGYSEGAASFPENLRATAEKDLSWASRQGIPIVMFDCSPIIGAFPDFSFRPYQNVFPLSIDSQSLGQKTGEFLCSMGHRRIAYFSYSSEYWVHERLMGLDRVRKLPVQSLGTVVPFQVGESKMPLQNPDSVDQKKLRKALSTIANELSPGFQKLENPSWPKIRGPISKMVLQQQTRLHMQLYFKKALSDRSLSAWVASDPEIAEAAARFLRMSGVSVPDEISLISIDDNETLSLTGTTACNIQIDRMGYLAAHCLLGDIPIKKNRKGVVVCPPRIIDRGSVARV